VILNGLAGAGLLGFLGASIDKIDLGRGLSFAVGAFACWLFGLCAAVWAGNTAYEAQKTFVGATRNRRHAAGYRLLGQNYTRLFGTRPGGAPARSSGAIHVATASS